MMVFSPPLPTSVSLFQKHFILFCRRKKNKARGSSSFFFWNNHYFHPSTSSFRMKQVEKIKHLLEEADHFRLKQCLKIQKKILLIKKNEFCILKKMKEKHCLIFELLKTKLFSISKNLKRNHFQSSKNEKKKTCFKFLKHLSVLNLTYCQLFSRM